MSSISYKFEAFRRWFWFSTLLILLTIPWSAALGGQGQWLTYKGAWFSITYPAGFTVWPSQRSATSTEGYDSVFFRSPDGQVEFFVYSPQWMGDPREIEMNPATEILVEERMEQMKNKRVRWVIIRAKDNSYYKSFVDEITSNNTRTVFGIIYRDQNAYQKYRQVYLIFKQSLIQYSD
jgi:hypothetical protein